MQDQREEEEKFARSRFTRRRSSEFATILEFQGEHQLFPSFSRAHEPVEYGGCPGNGNLRHESSTMRKAGTGNEGNLALLGRRNLPGVEVEI